MNLRLIHLNKQCHAITTRLFLQECQAMPQEQRVLDQRNRLLARRNQVRDSQLNFLLQALAPLERMRAPSAAPEQPTPARPNPMQCAQTQAPALETPGRWTGLTEAFRHAEAQLEGLQESAATCERILKLQRLMQRYRALSAPITGLSAVRQQRKQIGGHA